MDDDWRFHKNELRQRIASSMRFRSTGCSIGSVVASMKKIQKRSMNDTVPPPGRA